MKERLDASREIEALIATIDDDPDPLHFDSTPSVKRLAQLGLPALKALLELLDADDEGTRIRGYRALSGVVMRMNGWEPGYGYTDPHAGQEQTNAVLRANGDYQADDPADRRRASVNKWRQWVETEEGKSKGNADG